jgi:hypothetical protein
MNLVQILMTILGLAFTVGGILGQRRLSRLAKASNVPGAIVDSERQFTGKTMATFPTICFRTRTGAEVRVTVPQGKVFSRVKVGKSVRVIYDPAKPEEAYIASAGLRYGCYVFVGFGLGCLAVAILAAHSG